jgi:hypothetical protein
MEVDGWLGGIILICAYAMVSFGKVTPRGVAFQSLNVTGSAMLALTSSGLQLEWLV